MTECNPQVILRKYILDDVISKAIESNDFRQCNAFCRILEQHVTQKEVGLSYQIAMEIATEAEALEKDVNARKLGGKALAARLADKLEEKNYRERIKAMLKNDTFPYVGVKPPLRARIRLRK